MNNLGYTFYQSNKGKPFPGIDGCGDYLLYSKGDNWDGVRFETGELYNFNNGYYNFSHEIKIGEYIPVKDFPGRRAFLINQSGYKFIRNKADSEKYKQSRIYEEPVVLVVKDRKIFKKVYKDGSFGAMSLEPDWVFRQLSEGIWEYTTDYPGIDLFLKKVIKKEQEKTMTYKPKTDKVLAAVVSYLKSIGYKGNNGMSHHNYLIINESNKTFKNDLSISDGTQLATETDIFNLTAGPREIKVEIDGKIDLTAIVTKEGVKVGCRKFDLSDIDVLSGLKTKDNEVYEIFVGNRDGAMLLFSHFEKFGYSVANYKNFRDYELGMVKEWDYHYFIIDPKNKRVDGGRYQTYKNIFYGDIFTKLNQPKTVKISELPFSYINGKYSTTIDGRVIEFGQDVVDGLLAAKKEVLQ